MKILNLILVTLVFAWGCSSTSQRVSSDQLMDQDGILHLKGSDQPYTGIAFSNFSNGQTESEGTYKNGKPSGPVMHWFETGKMRSKLLYNDNGIHISTTTWYESGEKESAIQYTDKGSQVTEWYENGQLKTKANYNAFGQLEGSFQSWFSEGQKKEKAEYIGNIAKVGQVFWHPNGKKASELSGSDDNQILTLWGEEGNKLEEASLRNGIKHGPFHRWFPNGQQAEEGAFAEGKEHGTFRSWLPNGDLREEVMYVNGAIIEADNPVEE